MLKYTKTLSNFLFLYSTTLIANSIFALNRFPSLAFPITTPSITEGSFSTTFNMTKNSITEWNPAVPDISWFSVIGNTIVQSGQNEYLDKTINEFTVPEQVTFESIWIQREEDAKSLSKFIKDQWSKKQSVCELEVFSNPLISVGDIVTINYPANGLNGTQKFMVSGVNNSFDGGLTTKITTRSIYSL